MKQMREWTKNTPFNSLLGIRPVRGHKDGLTIECAVRKDLLNTAGVLHGGVTATVADAAAGMSIARLTGGKKRITTIEMKLNYFRPVAEGKLRARAYVIRLGSQIAVARVDLYDHKKNLAGAALVTYMILGDVTH
jgi:uncharacterized protein (TIGR00369 family)